jgi:hypothetical protein
MTSYGFEDFQRHRNQRDGDDADGDEREVVLHHRHVAEGVAGAEADAYPRPDHRRRCRTETWRRVIDAAPATNGTNVRMIFTGLRRVVRRIVRDRTQVERDDTRGSRRPRD